MGSFSDVKKMPLGKLSKTQIAKGFEVLEELEKAVDSKNRAQIMSLSSKFYTVIPHDFGRRVPPVMDTLETIRQKYDMLLVRIDFPPFIFFHLVSQAFANFCRFIKIKELKEFTIKSNIQ